MNALVSIIIPTYNRAHLIGETLDSIIAQTYGNWECIIVDDGSTDNTDEIVGKYLKEDSRFQYHLRPNDKPKGANTCRNYGFELSKGEFINWFDSDDLMMPDFISEKIKHFTKQICFVIGTGYYWGAESDERKFIDLNLQTSLFKDYTLWKLQILTPSILFRKSFLKGKELFLPKIKRGQEFELFSRLFYDLVYSDYIIVNKPLFLYRQHIDSKTFKDNCYVESYKESETFIAVENFRRSTERFDEELSRRFYTMLIRNFFLGIEKKHYKNSKYILTNFTPILYRMNVRLATEFFISGYIFLLIGRSSYRMERRLKNFKI